MSFTDHKITQFVHRIVDLPDQPNLPADELKARFDSSPEELRQAVNGICDDATTLSGKVDSILAETFDGVVEKSMLSEALAEEIDAKATQTALAAVSDDVTAEATARQNGDSSLSSRVSTVESSLTQKCQIYVGTYTGNGDAYQFISLGFTPKAVLSIAHGTEFQEGYLRQSGFAIQNSEAGPYGYTALEIVTNGFRAYYNVDVDSYQMLLNTSGQKYNYIAFR